MSLSDKREHVPYRDSTLTKLLSDCLGGSAVTMMIACCTPVMAFADESLRTLQYACSAASIRNRPVVKLDPQDQLISELRDEVQQLKAEMMEAADGPARSRKGPRACRVLGIW